MIKISKLFRQKGLCSTFLTSLVRYAPNLIEIDCQQHFFLIKHPIQRFSTKSSGLDSSIHTPQNKTTTYALRDYLTELENQPKGVLSSILQHIQNAIEQKDEFNLNFNNEDLQHISKLTQKIQDGETREAFRFILQVLETAGANKTLKLEGFLLAARNAQYKPLILDEIANFMSFLLKPEHFTLTEKLYEELKEFTLLVISSKYFSKQTKESAIDLLPLLFEYNLKKGKAGANSRFLEMLIDCLAPEKRGILTKSANNFLHDDFSDLKPSRPEKKVTSEQAAKIKEIVSSYKQNLMQGLQTYSIDDTYQLALANIMLNENSESLWTLLLQHCQSEPVNLKQITSTIIALSESTYAPLITVQSAKDCIFAFFEKIQKNAADYTLGESVSLMELFSICKMINYELFERLNKNIEAKFDQTNFKTLSKIIWIYSELPVSFSFEMPRSHLYHLIKQEYKKLSSNQFINLLLRLIKITLPNLKHDWKEFILLDSDLRASTINMLNSLKFQNLTESEKIKLLFLYKTLAKTALSGFINEASVRIKLKPLLSSFIAFHEKKSSDLQNDVEETLQSMKVQYSSERIIDDVFSVDLVVEENFCIEVDGPHHFYLVKQKNEQGAEEIYHMETRSTWMKAHLLEIMGYHSRSVRYYEWATLGNNSIDKRQYMRKLLREIK